MSKLDMKRRAVINEFDLYGHRTYIAQLAAIFGVNVNTLRQRVQGGWEIEAALIAKGGDGWNSASSGVLAAMPSTRKFVQKTLDNYFAEK